MTPFKTDAHLVSNYRFADGTLAFKVLRWDTRNGIESKRIRPACWDGKEWVFKNLVPSGQRPLLNLPEIVGFPDAKILIVEGEKTARAAEALVPDGWVVTCWANGASGLDAADLGPLQGRQCVMWPDNDGPGMDAAKRLLSLCHGTRIIDIPLSFPPKWDLADPLPEGFDHEWIIAQLSAPHAALPPMSDDEEERAAIKEIEGDPPTEDDQVLVIDPKAPLDTARLMVDKCHVYQDIRTLQHQQGIFAKWVHTHYAQYSEEQVRAGIYRFLDKVWAPAGKTIKPFKPKSMSVSQVLDAMRAVCQMSDDVRNPSWLVEQAINPPATELISCHNGLLHLPTGKIYPHTPNFFSNSALSYSYDQQAPKPFVWLKFLQEIWGDDQESIDTIQDIFGYLIGVDTDQQKLFLLVGPKRSGKGTIGRIINALLGEDAVISPTLASLETNFGIAPLIGKSAAIIADARLGGRADQHAIAERLLSISGEDKQTVDRKFMQAWSGRLTTRFLIMTNELPRIADASGALASRFIVLTMTKSFYGKEDRGLTGRLLKELPGILNWAIEGWRRVKSRGHFIQPVSSAEAIRDLEDLSSPIGAFLRERCVVGQGHHVGIDYLYEVWTGWCQDQGRDHSGTKQTFGRDLRSAVPGLSVTQPRDDAGRQYRAYEGISVKI